MTDRQTESIIVDINRLLGRLGAEINIFPGNLAYREPVGFLPYH